MFKKLSLMLSVAFVAFMLVACGGNDEPTEPTDEYEDEIITEDEGEADVGNESEEDANSLSPDDEIFFNWLGEMIVAIEDIEIDDDGDTMRFFASVGGLISGARNVLEGDDVYASAYLTAQIENVLDFLDGMAILAIDDDTDVVEIRDTTVEALTEIRENMIEQ